MSWLPTFYIFGTTLCEVDGEYEGRSLRIVWRSWAFEITLARWENADAR